MSYLLTEIAMEMLGWQFYDTNGVARPINLEGINLAKTEGAQSLEKALNINFLDEKLSVKAEADSSVKNETKAEVHREPDDVKAGIVFPYAIDTLSPGAYGESDDSKSSLLYTKDVEDLNWNSHTNTNAAETFIVNVSNNSFDFKIESVVGGVSLENDGAQEKLLDNESNFHTPLAITTMQSSPTQELSAHTELNTKHLKSSKKLAPEKKPKRTPKNWNVISTTKTPVIRNSAHPSGGASTSTNKSQTDCNNLELQLKLESEMFKAAFDLNREKALFLKSLDSDAKKNTQKFRIASEKYCKQEFDNLQIELKNLFQLRQHTEQLSASKFPKTYPKYLSKSNALSSNDLLLSAQLTVPITSKTSKLKKSHKSVE